MNNTKIDNNVVFDILRHLNKNTFLGRRNTVILIILLVTGCTFKSLEFFRYKDLRNLIDTGRTFIVLPNKSYDYKIEINKEKIELLEKIEWIEEFMKKHNELFINSQGKSVKSTSIYIYMTKLFKSLGYENLTVKDFRDIGYNNANLELLEECVLF